MTATNQVGNAAVICDRSPPRPKSSEPECRLSGILRFDVGNPTISAAVCRSEPRGGVLKVTNNAAISLTRQPSAAVSLSENITRGVKSGAAVVAA